MNEAYSWPPIAETENGTKVTAQQAKLMVGKFSIMGCEVTPCVGRIYKPYWRSINENDKYLRKGYEMSVWHYGKQVDALNSGIDIEYKITLPSGEYLFADAYDAKTNTIIEFVWSHYDPKKPQVYFDLGFNQEWIFADSRRSISQTRSDYNHANEYDWQSAYTGPVKELLPSIELPTVKVRYEK